MEANSNPSSEGASQPAVKSGIERRGSSISIDALDGFLDLSDALWFVACCKGGGVSLEMALHILKSGDPEIPIKARLVKMGLLAPSEPEGVPDQLLLDDEHLAMLRHRLASNDKALPPSPPVPRKDSPSPAV